MHSKIERKESTSKLSRRHKWWYKKNKKKHESEKIASLELYRRPSLRCKRKMLCARFLQKSWSDGSTATKPCDIFYSLTVLVTFRRILAKRRVWPCGRTTCAKWFTCVCISEECVHSEEKVPLWGHRSSDGKSFFFLFFLLSTQVCTSHSPKWNHFLSHLCHWVSSNMLTSPCAPKTHIPVATGNNYVKAARTAVAQHWH